MLLTNWYVEKRENYLKFFVRSLLTDYLGDFAITRVISLLTACQSSLKKGSPVEVRVDMYVANIWAMQEVKMVSTINSLKKARVFTSSDLFYCLYYHYHNSKNADFLMYDTESLVIRFEFF